MIENKIGPEIIDPQEAQRIRHILRHGKVVTGHFEDGELANLRAYFSLIGTFETVTPYPNGQTRLMWSSDLLQFHPTRAVLESSRQGNLLVKDHRGSLLQSIPPEQVRIIDTTEPGVVRRSGFVLPDHGYTLEDGRSFSPQELEEILVNAERNIEPPFYTPRPFIKVNPQLLLGYTLSILIFGTSPDNLNMGRDMVVMRRPLRSLVSRVVVWPLSFERFG